MSKESCSFARGLWSCLMNSLKFLLFIGIVILLLLTLLNMTVFHPVHVGMLNMLPNTPFLLKLVIPNISTLVLTIVGIFGVFHGHPGCLKTFSILATINALMIIFLVLSTGSVQHENDKYIAQLQLQMADYNWDYLKSKAVEHHKPTENWDHLQRARCCGISGPADWDPFRPKNISSNLYPRSCCPMRHWRFVADQPESQAYCADNQSLYRHGCKEVVLWYERVLLGFARFVVVYQLLLAFAASCIACHECKSIREEEEEQTVVQANLIFAHNQQVDKNTKGQNSEALYPNPHRIEHQNQFPPKYGSFE